MTELFFLPDWPRQASPMLWLAVVLAAGALGGEAAARLLRLPRITGYAAAGFLLGPSGSGLVGDASLGSLRIFIDIAIGFILFEVGQRLDLGWLRRNPALLMSSVLEAGLAFAAVFGVLSLLGFSPLLAACAAAIAMATSPAVVMTVMHEQRGQGQVSERLLLLSALNSVYAFLAVSMLFAWLNLEYRGGWSAIILHPLYLIFGSLLLGLVASALTLALLRWVGRRPEVQYVCVFALVLAAVAAASALKLPVLLALLAYGTLTRMLDRDHHFARLDFGRIGALFVVVLFTLSGASLSVEPVSQALWAAVVLIAARFAGKAVAIFALARPSGLQLRKASLLSVGLAPMSGIALALVQDTSAVFPQFGPSLAAVMLSAIILLEVFGPLAVQFALKRAGEVGEERQHV